MRFGGVVWTKPDIKCKYCNMLIPSETRRGSARKYCRACCNNGNRRRSYDIKRRRIFARVIRHSDGSRTVERWGHDYVEAHHCKDCNNEYHRVKNGENWARVLEEHPYEYSQHCRACIKEYNRRQRLKNLPLTPSEIRKREDSQRILEVHDYTGNPNHCKACKREYQRRWHENKKKNDPIYAFRQIMYFNFARAREYVGHIDGDKIRNELIKELDYTMHQLIEFIEGRPQGEAFHYWPNGLPENWHEPGKWEFDHMYGYWEAKKDGNLETIEDVLYLNRMENLQLLTPQENKAKHAETRRQWRLENE